MIVGTSTDSATDKNDSDSARIQREIHSSSSRNLAVPYTKQL
jgi:hypothetical protein